MEKSKLSDFLDSLGQDYKTYYSENVRELLYRILLPLKTDEFTMLSEMILKESRTAPKYKDIEECVNKVLRITRLGQKKDTSCSYCEGSGIARYWIYENDSEVNFKCDCNTYDKGKNRAVLPFSEQAILEFTKKPSKWKKLKINQTVHDDQNNTPITPEERQNFEDLLGKYYGTPKEASARKVINEEIKRRDNLSIDVSTAMSEKTTQEKIDKMHSMYSRHIKKTK